MPDGGLTDADFEKIVMDKQKDVLVLFYQPSAAFCSGNGTSYAAFMAAAADTWTTIVAAHMDVVAHKSPFVFEDGELPVVMIFPAEDKRPLEFDEAISSDALMAFAAEHATIAKKKAKDEV